MLYRILLIWSFGAPMKAEGVELGGVAELPPARVQRRRVHAGGGSVCSLGFSSLGTQRVHV